MGKESLQILAVNPLTPSLSNSMCPFVLQKSGPLKSLACQPETGWKVTVPWYQRERLCWPAHWQNTAANSVLRQVGKTQSLGLVLGPSRPQKECSLPFLGLAESIYGQIFPVPCSILLQALPGKHDSVNTVALCLCAWLLCLWLISSSKHTADRNLYLSS